MRQIKFRASDGKQKRFGYIQVAPYGIGWPDKSWMKFLGQFTNSAEQSIFMLVVSGTKIRLVNGNTRLVNGNTLMGRNGKLSVMYMKTQNF